MRLTRLTLSNFRCFESLQIELHPEMTVLIAPNGSGKTTLLDAVRIALWPFVKGFDLGTQAGKGASIQITDVRLSKQTADNMEPQLPCKIEAHGTWDDKSASPRTWVQMRERIKPGTNTLGDVESKQLTQFAGELEKQVRDQSTTVTLPLVSYLGTSRLWYEGRFTSIAEEVALSTSDYSRTSGYLNCLSYSSSFKTFTAWYGWIFRSYREEQIHALEKGTPLSETGQRFSNVIEVIKTAVDTLTADATGWHGLEYKASQNQQLVMHHEQFGCMPVDMLSDGVRNAIAMVADLAFRAYKLNPHLGAKAARLTPGIALIDEVDMFLHPSWQQTIVNALRRAFPLVQFIVTTHSPQVLSTVKQENIRIIDVTPQGLTTAAPPLGASYGEPSGNVLHSVMMVDPVPPISEKPALQRLTELVDQGLYRSVEVEQLMRYLIAVLGEQHPQLQRLQRSIQRQTRLGNMQSAGNSGR
jgi:predicted ATP-binding protein involved in virulence